MHLTVPSFALAIQRTRIWPSVGGFPMSTTALRVITYLTLAAACAACISCGTETATRNTALVATGYVRESMNVVTRCQQGNTLYGERITDSHWVFSKDAGTTWTDTGSATLTNTQLFQQCQFLHGFKFLATPDGRIFRTTPDDWTHWTEVSVPQRPAGTVNRPDMLVGNDSYLYYGTYFATMDQSSFVYRSADNGDTWVTVFSGLTNPDIHGITIDPAHPDHIFLDVGDQGSPGHGLWYSPSNGDPGSFIQLSAGWDGVDLLVRGADIIMEADTTTAQVLIFHQAATPQTEPTEILLQGDPNPPDGKGSLVGMARCMALTSEGNLFFISKPEGAPDRHRIGVWMAAGPAFDQEVLLEELTSVPLAKTLEVGPYLYVWNWRITKPALHLQ